MIDDQYTLADSVALSVSLTVNAAKVVTAPKTNHIFRILANNGITPRK